MAKKKRYVLHPHPQANKALLRFARAVKREIHGWNIREIARRLKVNHKYVRDNLVNGIEPPDTTPEGRAARVKMFMPERRKTEKQLVQCPQCKRMVSVTKAGKPRAHSPCMTKPQPEWKRRWMAIPKRQRDAWIEYVMNDEKLYKSLIAWMNKHEAKEPSR